MGEAAMRAYLKKTGASEEDVNTWIDQARLFPC